MNTDPVQVSPYNSPATSSFPGNSASKPGGVPPPPIMHPQHMNAYAMQSMSEGHVWALLMFPLILAGLLKLLLFHWWQGSFILLFTSSFLLAAFYAKRPHITHRLARILCAIFFVTFRDAKTRQPKKRVLRLSAAWAVTILSVVLFVWPKNGKILRAREPTPPPAKTEAAPRPLFQ